MKDNKPPQSSAQEGGSNSAADEAPSRTSNSSARRSRIHQSASESTPINFARPFNVSESDSNPLGHPVAEGSTDSSSAGHGRWISEGSDWSNFPPSPHSPFSSRPTTPLKIRRRGKMNDKKLTINVTSEKRESSTSRRVLSANNITTTKAWSPGKAAPVLSKPSKLSPSKLSPGKGKAKASPPAARQAGSPSESLNFRTPFTPNKSSPLNDTVTTPDRKVPAEASPESVTISLASENTDASDKALLDTKPSYGFNPAFQLGNEGKGTSSSPNTSPKDGSPSKPSPVYGSHMRSRVLNIPRTPTTPLSPRGMAKSQRSPHSAGLNSPRSKAPSTPRTPRTPRTQSSPRTPMGQRLITPANPAYRGVLLTTITRGSTSPRGPAEAFLDENSLGSTRRGRNRSASIATEIHRFIRGGRNEQVARLELHVLERAPQSHFPSADSEQGHTSLTADKRHSLAAAQSSTLLDKDTQKKLNEDNSTGGLVDDVATPRTRSFSQSLALAKLTGKRPSLASNRPVMRRPISSTFGMGFVRRERRDTGATIEWTKSRRSQLSNRSGLSNVTHRSGRSNRSNASRRLSMPMANMAGLSQTRSSNIGRRLSLAPSALRSHAQQMEMENNSEDEEDDIVGELNQRVNNNQEAKRWILASRPIYEVNADNVRDEYVERPISHFRRPTYATSVFQQARLIEADRSALDANASATHIPGTPGFPHAVTPAFPRTPGLSRFPKTPIMEFPEDGELEAIDDPSAGPELEEVAVPVTWQQKMVYYLLAPWRFLKEQIDPKYVLSMLNPIEIIFPLTLYKLALWTLYGGFIAMLVLLDHYYHWWDKFNHAVHGKNLAIMGVLYGFEPAMLIVIMLAARVPDARVVPDRTVLVPRSRDPNEPDSDTESQHSKQSEQSEEPVDERAVATNVHSTILEEEDGEEEEENHQGQNQGQSQSPKVQGSPAEEKPKSSPVYPNPVIRRLSTRLNSSSTGERRGSEAISVNFNLPPRTPSTPSHSAAPHTPRTQHFDPRNRRSTIILHEPINFEFQLERRDSRRPSGNSHQLQLARTASRESRRGSYFSAVAQAAGARLGVTSPSPGAAAASEIQVVDEKIENEKANSAPEVEDEDEKKEIKSDEVVVPMGGVTHPSLTDSTALIIPCHNADLEVLKAVLFAALVHFEPWQIFIVDNGNTPEPPEDIESEIRQQPMFSRLNYIWLPIGNKNIAQFVGAKAAAVLDLDYVLTIDDDVIIPPNFAAPMAMMSDFVTAVCYPITAVDHKGDRPLFVGWQDIEYKMSALAKMAESNLCGVLFPHGAASFWKRETMIRVLRRHVLVYFADDVKMGLELQAVGERMAFDGSISFETVAPETFLGPPVQGGMNFYHQRVRSWEMARHTLYWQFSKRFFFSLNGARTPVAITWQKFTQFYNSTTNFIDWVRLPMFVMLGGSGQFWLRSFAFILFMPVIPLIPYGFIKTRNRPDLHPHMLDMLTYGIYKLIFSLCCILGAVRSLLVFWPNHKRKPTLVEMEKNKDPRCIWLHEEFMKNSGGQGDLRNEPQQIYEAGDEMVEQQQAEEKTVEEAVVPALTENEGEKAQVLNVPSKPVFNEVRF